MKKLYTVREVAKILNFKPNTIRTWLKSGKLKGRKILDNSWRIHQDELQIFLEDEERLTGQTFPPLETTNED